MDARFLTGQSLLVTTGLALTLGHITYRKYSSAVKITKTSQEIIEDEEKTGLSSNSSNADDPPLRQSSSLEASSESISLNTNTKDPSLSKETGDIAESFKFDSPSQRKHFVGASPKECFTPRQALLETPSQRRRGIQFKTIFRALDLQSTGFIGWDDFQAFLCKQHQGGSAQAQFAAFLRQQRNPQQLFRELDPLGRGSLSFNDLEPLLLEAFAGQQQAQAQQQGQQGVGRSRAGSDIECIAEETEGEAELGDAATNTDSGACLPVQEERREGVAVGATGGVAAGAEGHSEADAGEIECERAEETVDREEGDSIETTVPAQPVVVTPVATGEASAAPEETVTAQAEASAAAAPPSAAAISQQAAAEQRSNKLARLFTATAHSSSSAASLAVPVSPSSPTVTTAVPAAAAAAAVAQPLSPLDIGASAQAIASPTPSAEAVAKAPSTAVATTAVERAVKYDAHTRRIVASHPVPFLPGTATLTADGELMVRMVSEYAQRLRASLRVDCHAVTAQLQLAEARARAVLAVLLDAGMPDTCAIARGVGTPPPPCTMVTAAASAAKGTALCFNVLRLRSRTYVECDEEVEELFEEVFDDLDDDDNGYIDAQELTQLLRSCEQDGSAVDMFCRLMTKKAGNPLPLFAMYSCVPGAPGVCWQEFLMLAVDNFSIEALRSLGFDDVGPALGGGQAGTPLRAAGGGGGGAAYDAQLAALLQQ